MSYVDSLIDVSSFQGTINWRDVQQSDAKIKAAYIKATEGTAFVSNAVRTLQYPQKAHAAGLTVGYYHYAHPNSDPAAEARFFVSTVGAPKIGDLPGAYDIEGAGWTSASARAATLRFGETYKALTGIWPMIYCSTSFWTGMLGSGTNLPAAYRRQLWAAHYGVRPGRPGVNGWLIHQYTSTGRVPGITGGVDCNITSVPLNQIVVGGSALGGGKWRTLYNVDNTFWIPGRAPVYALPKVPYAIADGNNTADARKVPADRMSGPRTGISPGWAQYYADLVFDQRFDARPAATFGLHFGLTRTGMTYGQPLKDALNEYGRRHGGLHTGNAGDWENLLANLNGQVRAD